MNPAKRFGRTLVVVSASCSVACLITLAPVASAAPQAPPAVPLSDCAQSDNGDPVVTGLTITPDRIDVTRRTRMVTFIATATDTGGPGPASGVNAVEVSLSVPGDVSSSSFALARAADGTWRTTRRFTPGQLGTKGTWPAMVTAVDRALNFGTAWPSDLQSVGADDGLAVVATGRDEAAPVLRALSLSRRTLDTRAKPRRVRLSAIISDNMSGVGRVRLLVSGAGRVFLRRSSGTERIGRWTGSVLVPRWVGNARWDLSIRVFDRAGNQRGYGRRALGAGGLPTGFRVTSGRDTTRPVVTSVTVSPTLVDVTASNQVVTLELRARDAQSGVWGGQFLLVDPSSVGAQGARPRLVSGTPQDGLWRSTAVIDRCTARAGTWTAEVDVFSRSRRGGTELTLTDQPLTVTARDNSPPRATTDGAMQSPAGPLRFTFDEDVTGVSTTSAVVAELRLGVRQLPIDGTWECRDGAGSTADCQGIAVREAWFTPRAPLRPSTNYELLINPEHVLDVRDLAGNPAPRRQWVYVRTAG